MFNCAVLLFGIIVLLAPGYVTAEMDNDATAEVDKAKDQSVSSSNVLPQYIQPPQPMLPPPPQQQQQPPHMMYPSAGQYPPPQYSQQLPPYRQYDAQPNSYNDIKSDISTLKDTVMMLSSLVKHNSKTTEGRTANTYSSASAYAKNPPPATNGYQSGDGHEGYSSGNNNNYHGGGSKKSYKQDNYTPDEAPPIQIEVIQTSNGYDKAYEKPVAK